MTNPRSSLRPRFAAPHPRFHGKAIAPILCAALRKLQCNFFAFFSFFFFFSLIFACPRGRGRKGEKIGSMRSVSDYSSRTNLDGPIASLLLRMGFTRMRDLRAFSEWERQSMLFVCCAGPPITRLCKRAFSFPLNASAK